MIDHLLLPLVKDSVLSLYNGVLPVLVVAYHLIVVVSVEAVVESTQGLRDYCFLHHVGEHLFSSGLGCEVSSHL